MTEAASTRTPQEEIVVACRVLYAMGQNDRVWGHVSVREETGRGAWMKGHHLGFEEMTPDDVVLLSWDGEVLEGTRGRHGEWPIHMAILRARPDVQAVVHTHPVYSIAFAATGWPLKALSHEGASFVPPDIPRFGEGQLVNRPEDGVELAEVLGDRNAALMPCHGIVTVGEDLGTAVAVAINLERACQIGLLAGEHAKGTPDALALEKRKDSVRSMRTHWHYRWRTAGGTPNP